MGLSFHTYIIMLLFSRQQAHHLEATHLKIPETHFEIINSDESFAARATLKRSFARMNSLVLFQRLGLRVALSTDITAVWLFTSMRSHVLFQIVRTRKRFTARNALVRSLAGVRSHVQKQTI